MLPASLSPVYRKVVRAIVSNQDIELIELPYAPDTGTTSLESLARWEGEQVAALIIPQPNFFGVLEPVHQLTDWAHARNALAIGVINPVAAAMLQPPGAWGTNGCDIAVGEGQPLGVPLAGGGPYFGFIACKQAHVRQMPGRIVGQTVDAEGKRGFTLTLQAREQHIRRSKATSNICTNQGLGGDRGDHIYGDGRPGRLAARRAGVPRKSAGTVGARHGGGRCAAPFRGAGVP